MNGIFGICSLGDTPVSADWLNLMADRLTQRGGAGRSLLQTLYFAMGYTHDATEGPAREEPQRHHHWSIVADSRLDNRDELCIHFGLDPDNCTDHLLILYAYERWQERCVDHLLGDFAFAIWDHRERQLFCAKDHAGVKPFLYYYSDEWLVFASELKAIVDLPFLPKRFNEDKLRAYLLNLCGSERSAETFFCDIRRLEPGRWLKLRNGQLQISRYWQPEQTPKLRLPDDQAYAEAFRELLERAVCDRLPASQTTGVTLSGGLDSSTITCLAARYLQDRGRPLYAVSAVLPADFGGPEEDERAYITAVKQQEPNLELAYVHTDGDSAFADLEAAFAQTYSPVNNFYYLDQVLYRTLLERWGVRRVLSGYAGDGTVSLNGGTALPQLLRQGRLATWYRSIQSKHALYGTSMWKLIRSKSIRPLVPPQILRRLQTLYKHIPPPLADTAINESFAGEIDYRRVIENDTLQTYHPHNIHRSIWNEYTNWFPEEDLPLETQFGLEVTYPFVDKRIIEFLMAIPPEQFIQGGWNRGLIRAATEGLLPPAIRWRKNKTLFSPDYTRKLIEEREALITQVQEARKNPLYRRYLNLDGIQSVLESATIPKNWSTFDNRMVTVVGRGLIALFYLQYWQKTFNFHALKVRDH